ncbi:MAG: rhomboid family intramembrane serine protease [Bacillota bacterium]
MGIFEANKRLQGFPATNPVSTLLIAAVTIMFVITILFGGFTERNLLELGALYEPIVIEEGQWYRLISVMFLHGSVSHYIFNTLFGLYIIGGALERLIGPVKYLIVYFASGLLASFTIVASYFISGDPVLTVGASGAIYGVLGAFLYLVVNHKEWFDPMDIQGIKGLIFINVVFTFIVPNISVAGHIGGLIAGYAIATLMYYNQGKDLRRRRKDFHDPFADPFEQKHRTLEEFDAFEYDDEDDDDENDPFAKYDRDD